MKMIMDKIKHIEEKTGNTVRIEIRENLNVDACIDFPNWNDRTKLPRIFHKKNVAPVHILHELVHLEMFFVDQYSLIATNDVSLHKVLDTFKNIPEDYAAHKILFYEYGLDPIDRKWFEGKNNFGFPDGVIAANLTNFYAFAEFCPEYKNQLSFLKKECKKLKPKAYLMANQSIQALNNMDYIKKESYNECAEELIKIFAWDYYMVDSIYLSFLSKDGNQWNWKR
jgi:hypothetical protein